MTTDLKPLTDADLDAIEAREKAATPGPWIPKHVKAVFLSDGTSEHHIRSRATGETIAYLLDEVDSTKRERDLEFLAAARSDVPRLVAEVRRLKRAGAAALVRLFEVTYDLRDGKRVCRHCHAEQHDYGSGHAPGCEAGTALEEAAEILEH